VCNGGTKALGYSLGLGSPDEVVVTPGR